jgi:hypothetical protein
VRRGGRDMQTLALSFSFTSLSFIDDRGLVVPTAKDHISHTCDLLPAIQRVNL